MLTLGLKLGNDLVDLSSPRIKLKHLNARFLQRVFTKEEQASILANNDNNSTILWAIWAAKEAAYKACKKLLPDLIFSHNKFAVELNTLANLKTKNFDNNNIYGFLLYKNLLINLNWQYNTNFVHCTAIILNNNSCFNNWEKINYNIFENIENTPTVDEMKPYFTERELATIFSETSLKTRFFAKKLLKTHGLNANIEILRYHNQPPMLYLGNQQLTNYELSFSHDGNFIAICYLC